MSNQNETRYQRKRKNNFNFGFNIIICVCLIIILIMICKAIKNRKIKSATNSTTNIIANEENIANDNTGNIKDENIYDNNNISINNENAINDMSKNNSLSSNNTLKSENGNVAGTEKKDTAKLTKGLPVLMYHFFYDNVTYFKKDNNWLKISDFEEQIKYMSENNFYFPTWNEVEKYVNGSISLPAKSVVITVDDGDPSFFDLAVPILQKYNITATSFVVTSWYGYRYDANMKNVVFESHSDNMHQAGANGKGRMVNWSYDEILKDIKTSSATLGNCNIFCYPFGHYNDIAIKALKDADYKLAFTTEGGRVKPGQNKYKLPRVRVSDGNSLKYFINSIN